MDSMQEDQLNLDFDGITIDVADSVTLGGGSITDLTWNSSYGAIPPNNYSTISISPNTWSNGWTTSGTGTSGQWILDGTALTAPVSAKIQLNGEDADIVVGEKSLMQILDGIEQRLGLLQCREDLESEWEELRALGDQYRATVKAIEEKTKMWNALKKMPPPEMP